MEELRQACAEVARRARSVRIDDDAIADYATSLPAAVPPAVDGGPDGARATTAERALYWLTLDAINFGSGWFPTLRKAPGLSGYGTIEAAWRAHVRTHGPRSADDLAALTRGELAAILHQDPTHELMELYTLSLNDFGARLLHGFDGDAGALVQATGGSALALARELGGWPSFADRSRYEELSIPFLKRAQIAAADMQRAGVTEWHDLDRLTMFADNLVPHVLRLDGVLWFDPALVARIDAGELIEHGSREEVEIRACAVDAVEQIVAARGGELNAADVDSILWHRGGGADYKAHPRHRSRCTAY